MKFVVDVESLSFVAKVSDKFGLPTVNDIGSDELIGPYAIDDDSGFLHYNAATRSWKKVEEVVRSGSILQPFDGMEADERDEVWSLLTIAELAPPPRYYPSDEKKLTFSELFIFQGRFFQWVYVPALKRWELAPHFKA